MYKYTICLLKSTFLSQNIYSNYNCTEVIDVLCVVEEIRLLQIIDAMARIWNVASIDASAPEDWVNAPEQHTLCVWMESTFQNGPFGWDFQC